MTRNATSPLANALATAEAAEAENALPPVHLWEPEYCGEIGMKITRDGLWHYGGSPIGRARLVRLFSTILRRDADGFFYLVTPVEKIRVEVEDAPFIATQMRVEGAGRAQLLTFETNVGDSTFAGKAHPLRVEIDDESGEPAPYIHVRARLDALISRAVFYELVALGQTHKGQFGVWSGGVFFAFTAAENLELA